MRYLIGIDEAGRGPLAGPVSVGAMMVPIDFDFSIVKGVRDSKQLSPEQRDEWYARLAALERQAALFFSVSFSSARIIDTKGIVFAIHSALQRCLEILHADPAECEVRLDGSLKAPEVFLNQTTIIRGDDLEPIISMASIVAKVRRDRLMVRFAKQYPQYSFELHKGYGTLAHRQAIGVHGLSRLHRATFCRNLPDSQAGLPKV